MPQIYIRGRICEYSLADLVFWIKARGNGWITWRAQP